MANYRIQTKPFGVGTSDDHIPLLTLIITGKGRKEGNVLFNDALNTFYLRLYDVRHMVKDHTDSKRGNPMLPQMGYSF